VCGIEPSVCVCVCVKQRELVCKWMWRESRNNYEVASTSRLLKIIRLFCKRALKKRQYSSKEKHNFNEPTNRSHHIPVWEALGAWNWREWPFPTAP